MKVIVAGSRSITKFAVVYNAIDQSEIDQNDITEVVSGGAKGVDQLGEFYAKEFDTPVKRFLPDWETHGKKAGILRNKEMGDYADALIAVWDGESKGTKHMIDYMKGLNKPVHVHIVKKET